MTIDNLMQAVLYTVITITSVSALAIALFASAAALERWLDSPGPIPRRPQVTPVATIPDAYFFGPGSNSEAA